MKTERKYRYNATENKMVKAYTIKEIFRDNWDDFVYEMAKQGKTIRPTIMEEVAKIMGCAVARPNERLRTLLVSRLRSAKTSAFYVQKSLL